ncbi:MAG: hypothetical protein KC621_24480 [Myxococcales bacterium]|nr:hypothetical protein [Myxococcales bacterium]
MRVVACLALLVACGKKAPVEAPKPEPAPAPAPVAAPMPAPAPEPEVVAQVERPPAERAHNADFMVAITYADGSGSKGHVVRVERSEDWFGESWTDAKAKLTVDLEADDGATSVEWSQMRTINVSYLGKEDIDCAMDSSFTPVMYQCTLRTDTSVKTADGKAWKAADRHKWRLILESGDVLEFWIYKLPARAQEEAVPELGTTSENVQMYTSLQAELATLKTGKVPKSITISVP